MSLLQDKILAGINRVISILEKNIKIKNYEKMSLLC